MADNSTTDNSTTDNNDEDMYADYEYNYRIAQFNVILLSIVLLINIFHLFILTRKELRTLSVFILMISICCCDIIYLITELIYYADNIRTFKRTDFCYGYDTYLTTEFMHFVNATDDGVQVASVWLVVLMAFYRSLSITFPLNNLINKLTSARSTILVVSAVIFIGYSWTTWPYFVIDKVYKRLDHNPCYFIKDVNATEPDQYQMVHYRDTQLLRDVLDWITISIMIIEEVLYAMFAILLIRSLRITQKNQKKLKNSSSNEEKKVSTTKLVLAMTLVFLITQSYHPLLVLLFTYILPDGTAASPALSRVFIGIKAALLIAHCSSHCIISLFMSTQYRDTVQRVFGIEKKTVKVNTSLAPSSS